MVEAAGEADEGPRPARAMTGQRSREAEPSQCQREKYRQEGEGRHSLHVDVYSFTSLPLLPTSTDESPMSIMMVLVLVLALPALAIAMRSRLTSPRALPSLQTMATRGAGQTRLLEIIEQRPQLSSLLQSEAAQYGICTGR